MPMLGKKVFTRQKPPKNIVPDEELFYCKITHELFREYEAFFDRVILCNSLVWTCCVTGRSGLTYPEAVESEKNARVSLKKFPQPLKKPILYLVTLTQRSRLNDVCDDVYNYVKDRYFIGETVEVLLGGSKKKCEVKRVILPDKPETPKADASTKKKTPVKNVNPDKFKYEIQDEQKRKLIVKSQCISRPKGLYTKPQNKLFIKHHSESENGLWKVQDKAIEKNDLENYNLQSAFPGPLPKYAVSPFKKKSPLSGKKTVQGKLNFKKESEEEKQKNVEKDQAEFIKHRMRIEEERQRRKEEQKKKIEDERERLKEQKIKEREQKKEEKRKQAEYLLSWKKPRDDLECDDLLDLPKPTPVDCNLPHECFGDTLMLLEFLNTFKTNIHLKDSFPHGVTFEILERALLETDIQGYFNDLLQLLMRANFQLQDWEVEKIFDSPKKNHIANFKNYTSESVEQASTIASIAATWPQLYHGTILENMPLDSFSITEILRLHILMSGSDKNRLAQLSPANVNEDPGLSFKVEEQELVKKLATTSVFQLSCEERLKILTLLMNQIVSASTVSNLIDENLNKSRPLRYELKHLRWAFARQKKEGTQSNVKKKPDEKNNSTATTEDNPKEENNEKKVEEEKKPEEKPLEEMSPRERSAYEEKLQKEAIKRKNDFLRKEKDLIAAISRLESSYQVTPLGRDRAYRRYWIFHSIQGVFIEDDDRYVGKCLLKETPPLISNPTIISRNENSVNTIRKYLQQLDNPKNGSSDKENDILQDLAIIQSDISMPFKDRKLCDLNPRVDPKKEIDSACNLCKEKAPRYCTHEKQSVFGVCTASIETCPVHNINTPRTKWSFLYKEEDLNSLLLALNVRGFREGPLKEMILRDEEIVKASMAKCQFNTLNKHLPVPAQPEVRKSQRNLDSRKSEFSNMKPHDALELTLRDMILEFEHRIYAGGLGSIKVKDRATWKQALEQRTYDMQCNELFLGSEKIVLDSKKDSSNHVVLEMACALLQISQGIEAKFLNPPLGEGDSFKNKIKIRGREDDEIVEPITVVKNAESPLQRWQSSLMECTSLSQLFVYLGTLERSVAWSRSVLKAHCRICRRRGDAENMLLCDSCNRGHHLYCLKPPLETIPQGDWFCLNCKPPEKTTPRKKVVQLSDSESDDDNEDEESDYEESAEDEEESEEEESAQEPVFEVCEKCGAGGEVICCDRCPAVYHPECVNLRRIPRGEWLCPKCTKKEEKKSRSSTRAAQSDNKGKSKTSPKIQIKAGTKRQRRYSSDDDWSGEVPPKRTKLEKLKKHTDQENSDSDGSLGPKKSKYDSAANTARRRPKSNIGDGDDMLDYKTCYDVLSELTKHPSSWPFLAPVRQKDAPDYHNVIKRPMDFGTIKSKLNNMSYKSNEDFVLDLFLVLQNCQLFNPRGSEEYKAARDIHEEMKKLLRNSSLSQYARIKSQLMRNVFI